MNDGPNMQDLLSFAAVAILLFEVALALVFKQRGNAKMARILIASGLMSAVALLFLAYFLF